MKFHFAIFIIILTALLSGCSNENKNVNNDSAYFLKESEPIHNQYKEDIKDGLEDNSYNRSDSKNPPVPQPSAVKKGVKTAKSSNIRVTLSNYLSSEENRNSIAERASELHGGDLHNSCVYYASEALRRVGFEISDSMSLIPPFIDELERQGFKTSYNLEELKEGDICFTTDVNGVFGGRPTHTYIFMGWESPGVARIVDNQLYDYGNVYHTRLIDFHYLGKQKDKPKEATAFFMYR